MESLLLFRRALPSPTMCRFIPALSVLLFPVKMTSPDIVQYGGSFRFRTCPLRRGRECYGVARRPRDSAILPRGLSMVQICVPCEVMHEAMS